MAVKYIDEYVWKVKKKATSEYWNDILVKYIDIR